MHHRAEINPVVIGGARMYLGDFLQVMRDMLM
jgi:hypothetical protein